MMKTDWEKYDLKARVLEMTEVYYRVTDGGEISEDMTDTVRYRFNDEGFLVEWEMLFGEESASRIEYSYDKEMLLIEERYFQKKDVLQQVSVKCYTDHNRLMKCEMFSETQELFQKEEFRYDAGGKQIESTMFNEKNKPIGKTIEEINEEERSVVKRNYAADGKMIFEEYSRSRCDGSIVEQKMVYPESGDYERIVYVYDSDGNPRDIFIFEKADVLKAKQSYEYDKLHQPKRLTIYSADYKTVEYTDLEIDELGNKIEEATYRVNKETGKKGDRLIQYKKYFYKYY